MSAASRSPASPDGREPSHQPVTADGSAPATRVRRGRPPSADRRIQIADAAIQVLAEEGARGLNHRAIDRWLALPDGSTSYYYPRRLDLLTATVRRVSELNIAETEAAHREMLAEPGPLSAHAFAKRSVELLLSRLTPPARPRTIAYFELTIDGVRNPDHRRIFRHEAKTLWRLSDTIFTRMGAQDPLLAARAYAAFSLGQLFMYTCRPDVRLKKADLIALFQGYLEQVQSLRR